MHLDNFYSLSNIKLQQLDITLCFKMKKHVLCGTHYWWCGYKWLQKWLASQKILDNHSPLFHLNNRQNFRFHWKTRYVEFCFQVYDLLILPTFIITFAHGWLIEYVFQRSYLNPYSHMTFEVVSIQSILQVCSRSCVN